MEAVLLKLSPPPASNFVEWERNFISKVQASRDYSFLGSCLRAGKQLPPRYLFSDVPMDFFFEESKTAIVVNPTVESISSSKSSNELVVKAKARIMEEYSRLAVLKFSLFGIILSALSDASLRMVNMNEKFEAIREGNNVYGLWELIRSVHLINSIMHSIQLEDKLKSMKWRGGTNFGEHLESYEALLHELKSLSS